MITFQGGAALLTLMLTAVSITPAFSQQPRAPEIGACLEQRLDQVADLAGLMAACQRVIGDSRAKTEERAEAHLRRGFAYAQRAGQTSSKEDIDRALADLAEAGRLVPGNQDVQKYVLEARASLSGAAEPAEPKSAVADKGGANITQIELLKAEVRKAQEAAKAAEERVAALESAKVAVPAPQPPEPAPAGPDRAKLARDLQSELKRVGCHPGAIDAQWGKQTQQALQRFAEHTTLALPLGEPTTAALEAVTARSDRVCPLACDANATEVNGTCVARQSKAKGQRRHVSSKSRRSQEGSAERPSGGVPFGITIGVGGRRGGVGIRF